MTREMEAEGNMQIVFISNYYNHHQAKLCQALNRLLNGNFVFLETEPMEQERISLGWGESDRPDYIWKSYESQEMAQKAQDLVDRADVAIYGCGPFEMLKTRLKNGKLTLWYSERIHKQGDGPAYKWPLRRVRYWLEFGRFPEFYLLCASAYAAWDFARAGTFKNKAYRWGYFPEAKQYDVSALIDSKEPGSILWVGRLIDWKHPEKAVLVAERLKQDGIPFRMTMVGSGELETSIRQMIQDKGLEKEITMTGSVPAAQVRSYMERAETYLFTSDRNEGWGAVMNEAMNSACGVVASHSIGAAPFLGKHEENCLLYRDSDFEDLYRKTCAMVQSPNLRRKLGEKAYRTICNMWNADMAAERLVKLCENLLRKEFVCEEEGPCSKAEVLPDNWF